MNLRKTTILVVFATFLLLALVLSISLQNVLGAHFRNEENQQNYLNLQRVNAAFRTNFAVLNYLADDWSNRPETFEFIQNQKQEFVTENLTEAAFNKLDVNVVIITDSEGNPILARGYDLEDDKFVNVPLEIENYIKVGQGILDFSGDSENNDGLIMLDGRPLLLAASTVTAGLDTNLIPGYFLLGRYFGEEEIQKLAQQVQFPVNIADMSDPSLPNDFALAKNYFSTSSDDTYSLPLTETNLGGYLLLRDVNQQPALIIRIEQFRSVAINTQLFLSYLYLALIASSLVFATIFFVLIERTILSRIFRLDKEVQAIAYDPETSNVVTVDKKDEISVLSQNINHMLDSLKYAEFERSIFEQRLKGIVASIDDIIFTVNTDLNEVKFFGNHPLLNIINTGRSEIVSIKPETSDIPEEWTQFHREKMKNVLTGNHLVYEWDVNFNNQRNFYQISLAPMIEANGEISGIAGVARNVNDLRNMQMALRQRYDELSVLFQMSRFFLEHKSLVQIEQEICQLLVDYFDADYAWLGIFSQENKGVRPVASAKISLSNINTSTIDKTLMQRNSATDSGVILLPNQQTMIKEQKQTFQLLLPINWQGGPEIGLFIQLIEENQLNDQQEKFLQSFANLAELVLSNSMLFDEVNRGRERMQDLSHQLVKVQEEERRWLARELHDEIGQYLTALKLQLEIETFADQKIKERIQKAENIANELIDKVRQMSLDLRPGILDDLGLLPALEWYFERYQRQSGIKVLFNHQQLKNRRFPAEVELTIFRIAQESLTNVARHAETDSVNIDIKVTEDEIQLNVQDEGIGFDQDADWIRKSNGIIGMLERANLAGGHFSIHSRINEGTLINVTLPVEPESNRDH